MPRIALKFTEEALTVIGQFTGAPSDVFGDENYALITIHTLEPLEMNLKLMTEEALFEELKSDSNIEIFAL